jgi:uncharacterized protein (TIGR02453 family)
VSEAAFEGFTQDTLGFLADLAANNEKAWFDSNRARYDDALLEREKLFVAAMGARMHRAVPGLEAVPRVNGSIFRINRDTRFSKDKTPYKTHADMWLWEGRNRKESSGFFVRIVPDEVWVGAGAHMLSREGVIHLRDAIADDRGEVLVEILDALRAAGYDIGEQALKRVPRGYLIDHPRAELLKFGSMAAMRREAVPDEFYSAEFVEWCAIRYEELLPLHRWLVDVLEG